MPRDNPSNPHTRDRGKTEREMPMPVSKARVVNVDEHPFGYGFHVVRVRVYGDQSTYLAPVIAPAHGSVWVPKEGQDVAVLFGNADKPWVIGAWYAIDRVQEGDVHLPEYVPGDIRMGNESRSHVTVHDDGHISAITESNQRLDTDHQSAKAITASGSIPNTYQKVTWEEQWDDEDDDGDGLFDGTENEFEILNDGEHRIDAQITCPDGGYNDTLLATDPSDGDDNNVRTAWEYTIALFKNGSELKNSSHHSVADKPITMQVSTIDKFNKDDIIDVRVKQDSNTTRSIDSGEFSIRREGI